MADDYCIPPEEFEDKFGRLPNEGETADDLRSAAKEKAIKDKARLAQDVKIQASLLEFLDQADNPEEALLNLLRPDRISKAGGRGTTTLEFEQDAVLFSAHRKLIDMMEEYRPFLGVRAITDSDPRNVVRALYGEEVDDAMAKKFADIWNEVNVDLVQRFNRAGGNIHMRGDWRLPQVHSVVKVAAVSQDEWVNDIAPMLDFEAMGIDIYSSGEQKEILESVYETISTGGLNKSLSERNMKLAVRRNRERFLQFKDAQSWLDYQAKYGNENVYSSLMDHVTGISKDIGTMEKFGSDPEATFKQLQEHALKGAKDKTKAARRLTRAQKVWDNTVGHIAALDTQFAHGAAAVRNVMAGSKLGLAIFSAFSDIALLRITAAFNGMPITRPILRHLRNIANGKDSDRLASRLVLGLEHAIDATHTANRYSDVVGHGASSKFADFVIRSTGLNHWTVSAKQAFGIEFIGFITDRIMTGKPPKAFKMYGIEPEDVAALKKQPTFVDNGTTYLDVANFTDPELQKKIVGMTIAEQRMAVPEPDIGVRAMLNQGTRAGTIMGEVARMGTQFKSFPTAMITGHLARMWHQTGGAKGRLKYGASLIVSTTIMGTFAVLAKEFAGKGEAPTKESITPSLLFKGFVQGGSGAFVVDILASQADSSFFKSGIVDTIAGPTAGTLDRVLFEITFGEMKKAVKGDKEPHEAAVATLAKQLETFVPNMPFIKLLIQREVLAGMHKMGDPKWARKQRQYQRKRLKETGNEYWYPPR